MSENKTIQFFLGSKGRWLLFLLWTLLITGFWLPRTWSFYGGADWDLTYAQFEAARQSIVNYHQFPLWNPWMSFGSDLMANPQSSHLSIFFIPILLFGTFYGYKISIVLAMVLGFEGAYQLIYKISREIKTAIAIGLMFGSSLYFAAHVFSGGHSNVLYFNLLPWLVYCIASIKEQYRFSRLLLAVLILMQMIVGGAPVVFLISAALCFMWAIWEWLYTRKGRFFFSLMGLFATAIVLSFWKILPGLMLWSETPRLVTDASGISPLTWLQSLSGSPARTGTWHAWMEYTLGFDMVLLALIAYYRKSLPGKWWQWGIPFLLLLWFCLGNYPPVANPWFWLNHYVPVFTSLRAPSRFGIALVLVIYAALAYVLQSATDKKLLYFILFFGVISRGIAFSSEASFLADSPQMIPEDVLPMQENLSLRPIVSKGEDQQKQFLHILNHEPVLNAYEPLSLRPVFDTMRNMISGGQFTYYSPNEMHIKAKSHTVVLCTRFSNYWRLQGKGQIKYRSGLLSVSQAEGDLQLQYRNPWVIRGMLYSIFTIPFLLFTALGFRSLSGRRS